MAAENLCAKLFGCSTFAQFGQVEGMKVNGKTVETRLYVLFEEHIRTDSNNFEQILFKETHVASWTEGWERLNWIQRPR